MSDDEAKRRLIEIVERLRLDALSGRLSADQLIDRAREAAREIGLLRSELRRSRFVLSEEAPMEAP